MACFRTYHKLSVQQISALFTTSSRWSVVAISELWELLHANPTQRTPMLSSPSYERVSQRILDFWRRSSPFWGLSIIPTLWSSTNATSITATFILSWNTALVVNFSTVSLLRRDSPSTRPQTSWVKCCRLSNIFTATVSSIEISSPRTISWTTQVSLRRLRWSTSVFRRDSLNNKRRKKCTQL